MPCRESDDGVVLWRPGNAGRGKAIATTTAMQRNTHHAQE